MTVTSSLKQSRLLTFEYWKPFLEGGLFGLAMAFFIFAVLMPDNREISADNYRWLMEQVESYPEIKDQVYDELSDNGTISNWELWELKRKIRKHARDALLEKLRAEPQP